MLHEEDESKWIGGRFQWESKKTIINMRVIIPGSSCKKDLIQEKQ